ncbi:DUF1707 domain-containing protein [Kribbella sp. NPDC000426]|uniref:DUF1707 SHOCT-like domain-containing protein n=1 Tax=Kribbella sp. NPDC000426 TaxID=3154255 RepID=UPI00331BD279
MGDEPALEHALLEQLQFAPLSRAELVRRTGAGERRVQVALDDLIQGTFVVRRPQDAGPADYEITAAGFGRLQVVDELLGSPLKMMGKLFVATVADTVRPQQTTPEDPRDLLLSKEDRSDCLQALEIECAVGQIDEAELARRTQLLLTANTRGELDPVFRGLPMPELVDPVTLPPGVKGPTWGTVALMLLPVLVIVGFIAASLGFGHASLPTAVLFIIAVVGVMLWPFRSRRK